MYRLVLLVMALSVVVAACGSDSDSDDSAANKEPAAGREDAAGGSPLRIGVMVNASGEVETGEVDGKAVLEAWAKAVNAGGGVADHPVEFVIKDSKGDATIALEAAEALVDEEVVAIVALDGTVEGVFAPAITEAGIPVIGGVGYDPEIWGVLPNWFSLTQDFVSLVNSGVKLAAAQGSSTLAFTVCDDVAACTAIDPLARESAEAQGLRYAGTIPVDKEAPDYVAECLNLIEEEVDFVLLGDTADANSRLVDSCATQGYTGEWGTFGAGVSPTILIEEDSGETIHLAINAFPWWVDAAPVAEYRQMMKEQGVPEYSDEGGWGAPTATAAYATMELFRHALEANASSLPASPTARDVIEVYGTIADETLDGLLPQPVTFQADQPAPPITCWWVAAFDNGEFTGASFAEPACES